MSIKTWEKYQPNAQVPSAQYPYGALKKETTLGAGDGTPLDVDWGNDFEAFKQTGFDRSGLVPSGTTDTVINSETFNAMQDATTRILWERSASESGYNLVVGSFEEGGTVTSENDVLWYKKENKVYSYVGTFPHSVLVNSIPSNEPGQWADKTNEQLRNQLGSNGGAGLVGGVAKPSAYSNFAGGADPSTPDNLSALNVIFSQNEEVRLSEGNFNTSSGITSSGAGSLSLHGVPGATNIVATSNGDLLTVSGKSSVAISDVTLDVSLPGVAGDDHAAVFVDQGNTTLRGLSVKGLRDVGSGIIFYSLSNTQYTGVRVESSNVEGQRLDSTNTNGVLLSSAKLCDILSPHVSGIVSFGVELKNNSQWNITTSGKAYNSLAGLYYGSDTVGLYPSANLGVGFIAADCDYGYQAGFGDNNLLVGLLADMRSSIPIIPEGIRVDGEEGSVFASHIIGDGYGVRYQAGAYNNYTQLSYHPDTVSVKHVVLSLGAQRNVTEIVHPGLDLKTVTNNILDNTAQPLSGQNSNPVFCHAVGEYLGVMSDGWRWVHAYSGATRASSHKWRYEGAGDSLISVSTDGVGQAGLNVNNPTGNRNLTWNESGAYWQIDGGSYGMRFYSSTLRPNSDNLMDFGSASFRGRTAYFGTGAINTSDATEKTKPVEITNDILDIADSIEIVLYQWLSSIQQKGEDIARWHFGVIAQQIRDAFASKGIDGCRYGLLCYDEWEDQFEDIYDEVVGEDGTVSVICTGRKLVLSAGSRWGVRPDQCLWLCLAATKRRMQRIESRLSMLEQNLIK